jgi:hypothetical protein
LCRGSSGFTTTFTTVGGGLRRDPTLNRGFADPFGLAIALRGRGFAGEPVDATFAFALALVITFAPAVALRTPVTAELFLTFATFTPRLCNGRRVISAYVR